ncbi:MAG: AMP-binding protein, partial [Thermoplasmata archaeon]|nr:AMP-binding protein [Thermoplasmata archaeon]NIS20724.1 AMP-binding protein [Thermoplasmata archaeon]NIT78128.1 AMP-binding protein [Thermoplasmata archaeon]NIU49796.1 AMP-binding protein [Thermoplasmata archaeon]NIV79487.1 AMP-binding protein [Thermoplasmata archaeon]
MSKACVDRWAGTEPDHTAIRSLKEDGAVRELTYGELLDRVGKVAGVLRNLGVNRGDAVAVYLPMSQEAV